MKPRLVLLLGALATALATARAEVEFAGYLCSPSDLKFVLTDRGARQTSDMLGIGGSFAGYRVTAFDAKAETLTVEKDGELRRLRLKNAVLVDASAATGPAAAAGPPGRTAAGSAERLIASATDAQIKLIREQQLQLSRQQDAAWQTAARLRETLPADHPQRIAAEAAVAQGAQRLNRSALQIERIVLNRLFEDLRATGNGGPQRIAAVQAQLRDLDARIASASAALAPSPPAK